MIVRQLKNTEAEGRRISAEGWDSHRLLLKQDGMGFSFHITKIHAGAELHLHYKNHFESVYCIDGKGQIESCNTGERWDIEPGTMYALNNNDKHILRGHTEMTMACVFNPPLNGKEVHDASGAYALEAETIDA